MRTGHEAGLRRPQDTASLPVVLLLCLLATVLSAQGPTAAPVDALDQALAAMAVPETGAAQLTAEDAAAALLQDFAGDPNLPTALCCLGEAWDEQGRPEPARSLFRAVLRRFPGDPAALRAQFDLGVSLIAGKRVAEAQAEVDRLAAGYPDDPCTPGYLVALGYAWLEAEQLEQALKTHTDVLETYPESEQVRAAQLGRTQALAALGCVDEVRAVMTEYITQYAQDPVLGREVHAVVRQAMACASRLLYAYVRYSPHPILPIDFGGEEVGETVRCMRLASELCHQTLDVAGNLSEMDQADLLRLSAQSRGCVGDVGVALADWQTLAEAYPNDPERYLALTGIGKCAGELYRLRVLTRPEYRALAEPAYEAVLASDAPLPYRERAEKMLRSFHPPARRAARGVVTPTRGGGRTGSAPSDR